MPVTHKPGISANVAFSPVSKICKSIRSCTRKMKRHSSLLNMKEIPRKIARLSGAFSRILGEIKQYFGGKTDN